MADTKELLKKLGFDITKVEAATDLDVIITEHNTSQRTHYETILKNDGWKTKDEFDTEIKSHDGKTTGTLNNELKKFGIPLAEIETLSIKDKFAKLKEFQETEAGKADKAGKDEVLNLQKENLELKNKVNDFPAELDKVKGEAKTEYEGKIKSDKISLKMKEGFVGIPKERVIGNQHSDGMFKAINATISATYDADIDEKGELVFYNKGSKTRPVTKQDGKEILMNAGDIFTSTLKELNFYVESNGKGTQGNQGASGQQQSSGQGQHGRGGKAVPPEMQQRLEEMKS